MTIFEVSNTLGAGFLERVYQRAPERLCTEHTAKFLSRAAAVKAKKVASAVMRSAQDFHVGRSPRPEPLQWLDTLIAAYKDDLDLLLQIEGELPEFTLALRERAIEIDQLIVTAIRAKPSGEEGFLAEISRILNSLGIRYCALGHPEDALAPSEEAAGIYRQLVAARPDPFLPDLAGSLNNIGACYSALGRHDDALTAAGEAVKIRRQLAAARPDAFLPNVAVSLSGLGIRYSALGRHDDALAAFEESVKLYRQFAAARPDAFPLEFARTLAAHGNALKAADRTIAAAAAFHEGARLLSPQPLRNRRIFKPLLGFLAVSYLEVA